jgi:hypothetical protein
LQVNRFVPLHDYVEENYAEEEKNGSHWWDLTVSLSVHLQATVPVGYNTVGCLKSTVILLELQ